MVVKVDIQKLRAGEYFSNRYFLDVADPSDVDFVMVTNLVDTEKLISADDVEFQLAIVSDNVPDTENFISWPLTGAGNISRSGNAIPGFMTVRVDWLAIPGRPGRKYYRTYVGEAELNGDVWDGTYFTLVQGLMDSLLVGRPELCKENGTRFTSATVKSVVAMRQLRRGSRRRTEPIL